MTATQDDARSPARRSASIHVLFSLATIAAIGWLGWEGMSHISSPVIAAGRPLQPVKDTEQELPARHYVLVHSRSDGAIEVPGRDQAALPLVLDQALKVERGQTMTASVAGLGEIGVKVV